MIRELCKWVKDIFVTPSVETIARRELDESKRRLLEAQTACEYAYAMRQFREANVERLTAYLYKVTRGQS